MCEISQATFIHFRRQIKGMSVQESVLRNRNDRTPIGGQARFGFDENLANRFTVGRRQMRIFRQWDFARKSIQDSLED